MALKDLYEQIEQDKLNREVNNIPAQEIRDIINTLIDESGRVLVVAVTKLLNSIAEERGYVRDVKISHVTSAIKADKRLYTIKENRYLWIERYDEM